MKFGLAVMNDFAPGVVPADRVAALREQVRLARDAGLSSIWALQHVLGNLPTLQPLPLLAALAEDSGEMTLGTSMLVLPLHQPVTVAEEFATLDHLTNGRAVAGFAAGYRDNEFETYGIDKKSRGKILTEAIDLIGQLWSGESVSFAGDFFNVDDQKISLKPVQAGGPPIWMGAGPTPAGARRAARLGDGWILPPAVSPEKIQTAVQGYHEERAKLGRDGGTFALRRELVLDHDADRARAIGAAARDGVTKAYGEFNAPDKQGNYDHLTDAAAAERVIDESYIFTDPQTAVGKFKVLEAQGVDHIVLRMQWYDMPQDQVLNTLELFRAEVLPAFQNQ